MHSTFHWQGRNDAEEQGDTRRFYNQVLSPDQAHSDYGLIGFACDLGVAANLGRVGAKKAPDAIRAQLANLAWHGKNQIITDFGNVEANEDLAQAQTLMSKQIVQALLKCKERVLVLGGGHETALTSLNALHELYFSKSSKHKLGIINFDAHFDLRQPSARGNSSGTPFYQAKQLFKEQFEYCCLGICAEANTQALFNRAKEYGVTYLLDTQINHSDLSDAKECMQRFCTDKTLLYISIDLDVLPHYQAPGVSAPAARGVRLELIEQLLIFIEQYAADHNISIRLIEISELNPEFDQQAMTAKTAAMLANRLLVKPSGITFSP